MTFEEDVGGILEEDQAEHDVRPVDGLARIDPAVPGC
jgi:hypothetical protein